MSSKLTNQEKRDLVALCGGSLFCVAAYKSGRWRREKTVNSWEQARKHADVLLQENPKIEKAVVLRLDTNVAINGVYGR